jgi:hypothetical protein
MANFYDPKTGQPMTSVKAFNGATVRVGLWGGGPNKEVLKVTTRTIDSTPGQPDPAVTLVSADKANWKWVYDIDTSKAASRTVRALHGSGDYAAPVNLVSLGNAPAASKDKAETRKRIVDLARTFVADAHYLWGTGGNTPGQSDGNAGGGKTSAATIRKYSLDAKATQQDLVLAVNVAFQAKFDGYSSCAGRCNRFSDAPNLEDYLNARRNDVASGKPDSEWSGAGSGNKLHPRKYYFRGKLADAGNVVWGESCRGVRHFDCIGLVNYCYAKFWKGGGAFGRSIEDMATANAGNVPISNPSDLMDADILIKPPAKHIALLYNAGGVWRVVQASQTQDGLSDGEVYVPSAWSRYRTLSQCLT